MLFIAHASDRNISPVLSERSPSCNDANVIASRLEKDDLKAAEDAYNTLLHMGGRPTCPTQYRNGLKSDGCQTDHLLQYPNEGARLRAELEKWRAFRDHQKAVRKDLSTFRKAQIYVNSYWQKRGLRQEFKPQLLLNLQLQTKLEEWKEFYFHQHQRLVQKEKEMKETEWQAQISLKKMITTTSRYRDSLEGADGWYRAAQVDLEAYNGWLAWIEGRIPKISSEHADKAQDVVKATKSQVKASRL